MDFDFRLAKYTLEMHIKHEFTYPRLGSFSWIGPIPNASEGLYFYSSYKKIVNLVFKSLSFVNDNAFYASREGFIDI